MIERRSSAGPAAGIPRGFVQRSYADLELERRLKYRCSLLTSATQQAHEAEVLDVHDQNCVERCGARVGNDAAVADTDRSAARFEAQVLSDISLCRHRRWNPLGKVQPECGEASVGGFGGCPHGSSENLLAHRSYELGASMHPFGS